jgi:hypothetical protein
VKIRIVSSKTKFTYWVLGDYPLLGTPFERNRANIAGQPQTVNLACADNGILPVSGNYKRIVKELNPGLTDKMLVDMMDKWTPAGAKWRDGDEKVPAEIIFADNPINVLGMFPNIGGLSGIPVGALVYLLDTLDYDTLFMYTARTLPRKYVMHFTVNLNNSSVVNPVDVLGGRSGIPIRLPIVSKSPMYIRKELLDVIGSRKNIYNPPWKYGEV